MEEKTAFAHVSPARPCPLQTLKSAILLTALRLWQMPAGLSIARRQILITGLRINGTEVSRHYHRFPMSGEIF
jgi:hypothetical protein